ncbi:MAG: DNA mismatch repair protein MutS [Candidatus Asgardarchaeia archaeon]
MVELKISPMMRQYMKLKRKYKDAILFFRVGDFYETFGEDAITVSKELGIVLTSRDKSKDPTPMAGVPHHSADQYIARLVKKGYKVAIAEQLEEPDPKKKVVERGVVRVITPGTIIEEMLLDEKTNNYLASIVRAKKGFGFSIVDVSTGEFLTTQIEGERALDDLIAELAKFFPRECIIPESQYHDEKLIEKIKENINTTFTPLPDYYFDVDYAKDTLLEHFNVASLEAFGCANLPLSISASGAIILYLMDTQKTKLNNIRTLRTYFTKKFMVLDSTTIRNLELIQNFRDGSSKGTLLEVLDNTVTAMGSRLLKKWILQPLQDKNEINMRLNAVEELAQNAIMRKTLRELIDKIYDLSRIVSRLNLGRLNPKDVIALKDSLKVVPEISKAISEVKSKLLLNLKSELNEFPDLVELIERAIVPDPPPTIQEGGIIKDGYNEELDNLRQILREGKNWIASLEQKERMRTGIKSLKVGYNKVFGYYIEVPKTHSSRVPKDYIRKQTLTNAERYITPELKEYEAKILNADENIKSLEFAIFDRLRKKVATYISRIQKTAQKIAELDVLSAFAENALKRGYVKPEINDSLDIIIREGRHPVLEEVLGRSKFVPNDTVIRYNENQISIVTGPNMAGKSTYLRQVALIVLMAQIGSFVPAAEASIGIVDRIFTRVGASDDISLGHSTFMVEMTEVANILNNATSRSLVILDEVGRGTSTYDGVSIAWAITEYLHNNPSVAPRTIFATHYHELTQLEEVLQRVANYNVSVKEWKNNIIFLHKIIPGASDKSYGIHVAKLAGLPDSVLTRAEEILRELENNDQNITHNISPQEDIQLTLFNLQDNRVIEMLKNIDINNITPIQALLKLQEMKEVISDKK